MGNMSKNISDFCKTCKTCQREGFAALNTKNKMIISNNENDLWQLDLIGPIGIGKSKGFVIMGLDHYSKSIDTKAINHKSEHNILGFLKTMIERRQATPKKILVDSGKEFNNNLLKRFCERPEYAWNSHH
ncbi:putative transposable element protein [Pseudoloma neurophilia]|uniref:Putative transposable element protein n=1 Tax=Pseudoloma neurophilia TaxID=146866 RepID=A0A0R0LZN2_9MICR|nr:putative transposable element protein [Pseudoloma neurophilia]